MIINADLSIVYLYAGRYDAAEAQARKTLEIDSRSFVAHYYLGAALQLTSRLKEAIPEFQKAVELNNDPYSIAMLAQAYARNGQTDEARKLLAHLNEMAKSAEVPDYALATAYTSLGKNNAPSKHSSTALREAIKATCSSSREIHSSTIFAAIRASKRWWRRLLAANDEDR